MFLDEQKLQNLVNKLEQNIEKLYKECCEMLKHRWVFMDNKKVYYDNEVVSLFPDLNYYKAIWYDGSLKLFELKRNYKDALNFEKLDWDIMTLEENQICFNKNENYPFKTGDYYVLYDKENNYSDYAVSYKKNESIFSRYIFNNGNEYNAYLIIPIHRLNGENSKKLSNTEVFMIWLKNGLIPKESKHKELYEDIINVYKSYKIEVIDDKFKIINKEKLDNDLEKSLIDEFKDELLSSDQIRAGLYKYDENLLVDKNKGHWELNIEKEKYSKLKQLIEQRFFYKDPTKDIKENLKVSIDFGIKNTAISYQDEDENILPIKIGLDDYKKPISINDYENPTFMEFINIVEFFKEYNKNTQRPKTKWQDLKVCHEAYFDYQNEEANLKYAYFNNLKKYCFNKDQKTILKDKNNNVFELPIYINQQEDEIDLIEIYAYYLGLYINNMKNGIYLDYVLSFSVNYEKQIIDKIRCSFEKGLKKSLPLEVIENEEIMKNFSVKLGLDNGLSYAVSALTEYKFEPTDDEKICYGVFDFGGGSTNFNFGTFKEANQKTERRFDYILESFDSMGDKYLGGENLLHLLSFEVFKDNKDVLRENKISFTMHPECKKFPGYECIINSSREALLNTNILMEKLRNFWENHENYDKFYKDNIINANLYSSDLNVIKNIDLTVDFKKLENILYNRIEKGVKSFFENLKLSFSQKDFEASKVNIFLGGNSSKSTIVKHLFYTYSSSEDLEIEVFPPLATKECYKKQEELNIKVSLDDLTKPTAKTAVSFGLFEANKRIKIINNQVENNFNYYVGYNKKNKFIPVLTPDTNFNEWVEFIDASEERFEIYYTTFKQASTNNLDISDVFKLKLRLEKCFDEETFIYLRISSQNIIECAVKKNEEFLTEIHKIELK